MDGLLPLDKAEHPDPRLCPCDLTGKCCAAGVFPRNGWSFHPVCLDHVAGNRSFVAFVARFQGFIY
ncbi:MAG: hypothetical protein WB611_10630 [Stellaceae bacterium]